MGSALLMDALLLVAIAATVLIASVGVWWLAGMEPETPETDNPEGN